MSRLKLFLLLLIIALLGIIFVQNQEPIALKLLCPDNVQSCLYKTPQLPLAIWIGLFVLAGMTTNLFWQLLNSLSQSSSGQQKYQPDNLERNSRNWASIENEEDNYPSSQTSIQDTATTKEKLYSSTSYEVPQKPENVERSGSTYSYKYRAASDEQQNSNNEAQKTSIESELNLDKEEEDDDENWI